MYGCLGVCVWVCSSMGVCVWKCYLSVVCVCLDPLRRFRVPRSFWQNWLCIQMHCQPTNGKQFQQKSKNFQLYPRFPFQIFSPVSWWIHGVEESTTFVILISYPPSGLAECKLGKKEYFWKKMFVFPLGVRFNGFSIDSTFKAIKFFLLKKRVTKCSGEKQ